MKSNSQQDLEVIESEEIPLEQVIDNTLVRANITNKVLAELKERYGNVRLKSVDDKESYLECKASSREIRKVEILAEKICEAGRSEAIKTQRLWLFKQKELLEKTALIKNPIDVEIKKFEDEEARKELDAQKKREEVYINRQSALSKMGAIYDNGSFVLNHISYEVELIKQSDDDMWNDTILPKYKKVFEEIEASKVEEENKRKAELEEQKRQRDEFELQQKKFREEQELFAQQQADLQKQKDDADRKERLAQDQKDSEERIKKGQIIDTRINQLRGLGLSFNHIYNAYTFEDINIDMATEVNLLNDEEWSALIEKVTPIISQRKEESAKRIFDAAEKQKQADIQKALEDAEIKKQQEQQRKEEELAQASDRSKWAHYTSQLNAITIPEFKSNTYKKKVTICKEKLEEINEL